MYYTTGCAPLEVKKPTNSRFFMLFRPLCPAFSFTDVDTYASVSVMDTRFQVCVQEIRSIAIRR